MSFITRLSLILTLVLPIACGMSAQEVAAVAGTGTDTSATVATPSEEPSPTEGRAASSEEVRKRFDSLVRQRPPELGLILATEPALLSNDGFLAGYPELAKFVAQHPEIRTNPRFYLRAFRSPGENRAVENLTEAFGLGGMFLLFAFAFFWLVRTIIEQKRWNRLSRIQTEVHNKILDRFSTSQELLEYIRSSAGTKFLESAPIPLRAEQVAGNRPGNRVAWSIQVGIIVAAGALGMLAVSLRFEGESADALFAMGAVALCVGAGFIASGVVSIFLSRRLGPWLESGPVAADDRHEEVR